MITLSIIIAYLTAGTFFLVVFVESRGSIVPEVSYHGCHVRVTLLHGQFIRRLILLQTTHQLEYDLQRH